MKKNKTIKKWITTEDNHKVSFVHVSRPEKEIICFPSQIGCKVNCKFCISSTQPFVRSLTIEEMLSGIGLFTIPDNKPILYSCMGQGEPFHNLENVLKVMKQLNGRLAMSTANPTKKGVELLNKSNLSIKLQGSFSANNDLSALKFYSGAKELNVILIENVDITNAIKVADFIKADVKLSTFNSWVGCPVKPLKTNIELYSTDGVNLGASCGQQNYLKSA